MSVDKGKKIWLSKLQEECKRHSEGKMNHDKEEIEFFLLHHNMKQLSKVFSSKG